MGKPKEEEKMDLVYDNVTAFLPTCVDSSLISEFLTFDEAVDEYFSKEEQQRLELKATKVEKTALSKLARSKQQHEDRLQKLDASMEKNVFHARLIEENIEAIDQCIFAMNDLLYQGMDWHAIALRIKEEKSRGNPVAKYIVDLDLHNNSIVLNLPYTKPDENSDDEEDSDTDDSNFEEEEETFYRVSVQLDLSAMQN